MSEKNCKLKQSENVKRFELDVRLDMPKLLIDNVTNKRYHLLLVNDIEEIVDLLNQLHQENEHLIIGNKNLMKKNEQLQKENIFLAKQRNYWKGKCDRAVETFEIDEATATKIRELEKENERLKEFIELFNMRQKWKLYNTVINHTL